MSGYRKYVVDHYDGRWVVRKVTAEVFIVLSGSEDEALATAQSMAADLNEQIPFNEKWLS